MKSYNDDSLVISEPNAASADGGNDIPAAGVYQQAARLKFAANDTFLKVLRERVDELFISTSRRRRDCIEMYLKSATIFAWSVASYVLLVFWSTHWWEALPLAVSLGVSLACIGFSIQHDGGHSAYSSRKWINSLTAMALDLLGSSSYFWRKTHNTVHHTFTNITGHDGDIDLGILGRLSPHQPRRRFHRIQHLYLWALYGFIVIKWQFYDDFRSLINGRAGNFKVARPRGSDLVVFCGGKLLFFSLAFLIPMFFHVWYIVILFYFVATFVQGILLSVVFQLAHCVEEAEFPMPESGTTGIENAWAVHQVETTVNFARRNRLITWFSGSLNYQIEHHLFPKICHVNYPAVAVVVEKTCQEFGISYSAHDTFLSALMSHYRWLQQMGRAS
jgi:linoleoyl-CoA desaturase